MLGLLLTTKAAVRHMGDYDLRLARVNAGREARENKALVGESGSERIMTAAAGGGFGSRQIS
jgi:hypothetical protein